MIKIAQILAVIAALLIAFHVSAYASDSNQKQELTGSVLWKVSGNDLSKPSYIFGSHHLIPLSFLDSVSGLQEAIKSADGVVGEIVLADVQSKSMQMMQMMMMPDGSSYKKMLSPEDYSFLDSALMNVFGTRLNQMGMLRPMAITNLYVIALYQKMYPNSRENVPVDQYLQKIASEQGKAVEGLETFEEQMELLFLKQTVSEQLDELLCTLRNGDYQKKGLLELELYYRRGDLIALEKILNDENDPCRSDEMFKYELMAKRNNNWMEKLPAMMSKDAKLVVVGFGHLAGKEGILYQLREKGYRVEPVK